MKTARKRAVVPHGLRIALLALGVSAAASCDDGIDTTRIAPPKATLGDDMFGVFCDRLGASSFVEDLSGASFFGICHYDDKGHYQDKVDTSQLPPATDAQAKEARALSIAKLETLARRRVDLIRAINVVAPDAQIKDTVSGTGNIRLHDALLDFTQRLGSLYDTNPYDPKGEPLLPASTRAIGRLFGALTASSKARDSLARIWGRQGYRPSPVGLGALRPGLAYPKLRELAKATLAVLGPNGKSVPALEQLLTVGKQELSASAPVVAALSPLQVNDALAQPSRPRTNLEVTARILLSQDPTFAATDDEPARYIALRDRRGFVVPVGNTPGKPGTIAAPFVDLDGDGFADVDAFGRFVGASSSALTLDPPFTIPGTTTATPDSFGRTPGVPFQYLDTSRALTGALVRHLVPLFDPTSYVAPGPDAWKSEHETIMYALAGAYTLYGGREKAQYDYVHDAIVAGGMPCDGCVLYTRFRGEDSPLPGLLHAFGQVLADQDSDAFLLALIDLLQNHEDVVARLIGAALKIRDLSQMHDQLAAQGKEPAANLAYATPIWDQIAQTVAQITSRPGLMKKLIEALADDTIVTPFGSSQHMGEANATFALMKDELTYDPNNINGPAVNLTVGAPSTDDPEVPVDQNAPKNGKNVSLLQRSLRVIHDADGATACNKDGAVVHTNLGVDWPIVGSYAECELTTFSDESIFYLDSNLPANHPKRSQMVLKGAINDLLNILNTFGVAPDTVIAASSGIDGLGIYPEPAALNRLLFFGADSTMFPNMPDRDQVNAGGQTDTFITDLIEPAGTLSCPKDSNGVNTCTTPDDTLRIRDGNTMFAWERLGFLEYLKPMIEVFANESCTPDLSSCDTTDLSGEQLFVDLLGTLNAHWPGKDHGPECSNTGTNKTNPKYCSEAGVNHYEPLIADALRTDIVPALHAFAVAARDLSNITVARGPHAGETWAATDVLEKITRVLFDINYATSVGMVDRGGNASTTWVDGTPQPQLTTFTLLSDALHGIDTRFDGACGCDGLAGQALSDCQTNSGACKTDVATRRGQWQRARSQLVDEFLAVDGDGTAAAFKNRSLVRLLTNLLQTVREQLNANCPNRETGTPCTWAKKDLAAKFEQVLSGPLFAGMMDVTDALRADESARRELELFLQTIMQSTTSGDALEASLASISDMLQVLSDDGNMAPIFNAIANVSSPAGDTSGPGAADTMLSAMKALTSDDYDRYHVLDQILPALVTPMNDGSGLSPLETFMNVIADVDRSDASSEGPLTSDDYQLIMGTMHDFMIDPTRGLEQIYTIVKNQPHE